MSLSVDADASEKLLTVGEVAETLAVCKRTIWRWVALGRLPPPLRFSGRRVRWWARTIHTYQEKLHTTARAG